MASTRSSPSELPQGSSGLTEVLRALRRQGWTCERRKALGLPAPQSLRSPRDPVDDAARQRMVVLCTEANQTEPAGFSSSDDIDRVMNLTIEVESAPLLAVAPGDMEDASELLLDMLLAAESEGRIAGPVVTVRPDQRILGARFFVDAPDHAQAVDWGVRAFATGLSRVAVTLAGPPTEAAWSVARVEAEVVGASALPGDRPPLSGAA